MANDSERRVIRVMDYIHDNPAGDLSLDALADVAALSRFHFHRVFHALTGETAAQAVRRLRMHLAAAALVTTTDPVPRIARAVGYPSVASFHRAFAELYAATPAAFRKSGDLRPQPPVFQIGASRMYPVDIRDEPARRLAAVLHRGPYAEISAAFGQLGEIMGARGLTGDATAMIGVYFDDPAAVAAADLRAFAGLALPEDIGFGAALEEVRLPGGPHAVLRFQGPYDGLPAAYDQLYRDWLPKSGRQPADSPIFENYINTPMDTAPGDLVTEICLPLAP